MQQNSRVIRTPPGQNYFDLAGDRELLPSASEDSDVPVLTWRGAPIETGSDWTITVVTNELKTMTFHVHKSVIVYGPRRSKYFSKIIREKNKVDKFHTSRSPIRRRDDRNNHPNTKVELDQRDADNFQILLDFIYASGFSNKYGSGETVTTAESSLSYQSLSSAPTMESEISYADLGDVISTHNAVSLRHLARTFEVESLTLAVNKFIQKDLSFKTGPFYLSKAHEYQDERLIESAQRLCIENIDQIDKKALIRLPFHLFRSIVKSFESFQEDNINLSLYLSETVCRYLEKNTKSRSAETLIDLTDPLHMPYITSEAAIGFTAIIKSLDSEDANTHWTGLIKLSNRCARSVVKEYGWSDFSVNAAVDEYLKKPKENDNKDICRIDRLLFATSFAAALEQAQDDYVEMHTEQERLQSLVSALQDSFTTVERVIEKRNEQMERQQNALAIANETIAKLKGEIGEIRRQKIQQHQPYRSSPPPPPPPSQSYLDMARELVSPSRVGTDVYMNKQRSREECRTRDEMRLKSLIRD